MERVLAPIRWRCPSCARFNPLIDLGLHLYVEELYCQHCAASWQPSGFFTNDLPTRDLCAVCGRPSSVAYHVPPEFWKQVTEAHPGYLCVLCFVEKADEQRLAWEDQISFSPISLQTLEARTRNT